MVIDASIHCNQIQTTQTYENIDNSGKQGHVSEKKSHEVKTEDTN